MCTGSKYVGGKIVPVPKEAPKLEGIQGKKVNIILSHEFILKRITVCKPEGRRRIERSKLRWIHRVLEDIKELGVKNWWTVARDRKVWRKVLRKAEAHTGL